MAKTLSLDLRERVVAAVSSGAVSSAGGREVWRQRRERHSLVRA